MFASSKTEEQASEEHASRGDPLKITYAVRLLIPRPSRTVKDGNYFLGHFSNSQLSMKTKI